jgi:asparagine synthase (glutamine-hydrolysing)
MNNFVIRLPLGSGTAAADAAADARLRRLVQAGWSAPDPDLCAAVSGTGSVRRAGGLVFCGIARLVNGAALAARLGLPEPGTPEGPTDLDVIAALRLQGGRDALKDLDGSFAFIVHDPETGGIEGYRDHFGVYPFLHAATDGTLTCGSDLRAVLHLSACALTPDRETIAEFLAAVPRSIDRTCFAGLHRLPSAHRFHVTDGTVTSGPYWELVDTGETLPADGAAKTLHDRLSAAVDARLGGPGETGSMLSGGLDSSTIAGLAARTGRNRGYPALRTLSWVYPGKHYDESHYIAAANEAYGSDPHLMPMTDVVPLTEMAQVVEEQMEPFEAPGLLRRRKIYHDARALGLDALFDGHGGDEVISMGFGRLIELAAARRWRALYLNYKGATGERGRELWGGVLGFIHNYGRVRPGILRKAVGRVAKRLLADNIDVVGAMPNPLTDLVPQDLRDTVAAARERSGDAPLRMADWPRAERIKYLRTLKPAMVQTAFEVMHRAGTVAGIEPRYPFYDKALVEFSLALPSEVKLRDGVCRWVMTEAMKDVLPEIIRTRNNKARFDDEMREQLVDYFRAEPDLPAEDLAGLVDIDAAKRLQERILSGTYIGQERFALWRVAQLIFWTRAFSSWRDRQEKGTLV